MFVSSIISYALSLSLFLDSLRQVSTFPDVSCVLLQARLELKVYLHHHTVITLRTSVILAVAVTQATIGAIPIGCFVLATHTARFFRLFDSNFRCRNRFARYHPFQVVRRDAGGRSWEEHFRWEQVGIVKICTMGILNVLLELLQ